MNEPKIINGLLHAPFFIFVNCSQKLSDQELLEKLNLSNYKSKRLFGIRKKELYITHDKRWSHIADDWCYNLWHLETIQKSLEDLSKEFDIFTCSVGDCDHSYDFALYRKGTVERKYVVEDPDYNNPKVTTDFGQPLSNETEAFTKKDEFEIVMTLAKELKINTDYKNLNIKTYYSN